MSTEEYAVIGTRPIRHDGADKVTGRALYGADVQMAGLLHGFILRSPHAHARIRRIDTSKAAAFPGVKAVVTADDFPQVAERLVDLGEGDTPLSYARGNVLAQGKVLYRGHAVAAVAAASIHVAEEAAGLIEVDYEVLPCALTAPDAMREGAPILHENLKTKEFGEHTSRVSNVAEHFRHAMGDMDAGFAEAEVTVEREFNTATVHQGYIEPHNATALWNNDGRILVWCSTQGAFVVRDVTACLLDVPVSRVKVTPMEIGGGFGGARKDGRITAAQAYLAYEAGAYPGAMVAPGAMCVFAAYDIANVVIDGFDVVVNKPSTAAYRAPGATNAAFATESVVDEIAEKLGMDPLDFRLKNAAKQGTRRADGPKYRRIGCIEVIEAMKKHPHYSAPLGGPNRGRGVAIGFWFNVGLPSSCTISVNADGTVNLVEGSTDIGGTRTSIAMQAAEVLGIPAEAVRPTVVGRGYGFCRLHRGDRRQPHYFRHRLGRVRGRARYRPAVTRTRRQVIGGRGGVRHHGPWRFSRRR